MRACNVRCTVVEVPVVDDIHDGEVDVEPRDLLPWADPYIARLANKYRLQAALDESVRYLNDETRRFDDHAPRRPASRIDRRSGLPDTYRGLRFDD